VASRAIWPVDPIGRNPRALARGVDLGQDLESEVVSAANSEITFTIQTAAYRYDRFGLARI
jgi:hypothetical protein